MTLYDVDLEAANLGPLKKGVDGLGYALAVEVGKRMESGMGMSVTPRAGLVWSKVDMDDFTQQAGVRPRISVEDADSLAARVGVMLETAAGSQDAPGRMFGTLDVEHEFSDETSVNVAGNRLETTVEPTGVRLGLGGTFRLGEDLSLRAVAGYTMSSGGRNDFGGGVELGLRF